MCVLGSERTNKYKNATGHRLCLRYEDVVLERIRTSSFEHTLNPYNVSNPVTNVGLIAAGSLMIWKHVEDGKNFPTDRLWWPPGVQNTVWVLLLADPAEHPLLEEVSAGQIHSESLNVGAVHRRKTGHCDRAI